MTEDEARTRYCPLIQRRCIVSGCMMWRWMYASENAAKGQGYCGLAGTGSV